jgi:hypothetical protein
MAFHPQGFHDSVEELLNQMDFHNNVIATFCGKANLEEDLKCGVW